MKMNMSKSELTINPENVGDILELTDAELVQIQGGHRSGCNNRQSYHGSGDWGANDGCNNNGCNNESFHYHRQDRESYRHHSWSSKDDYNSYGFNNGYSFNNGCNRCSCHSCGCH